MNREKLTLLILAILMFTFTLSLDMYVFNTLEALNRTGAITIAIINIASVGLLYTVYLSFNNSGKSISKK